MQQNPSGSTSRLHYINLFIMLALALTECSRPMKPEEGKKYLRALDNDVIHMSQQIGNTPGVRALMKFFSLNTSGPFLQPQGDFDDKKNDRFMFNDTKGIYHYNSDSRSFIKVASCDSIIIFFPFHSEYDTMATFVITDYTEETTQLNITYPLSINAYITIGNIPVFTIQHQGSISHGFPVSGDLKMEFPAFSFRTKLHTKLYRDYAKMELEMNLSSSSKDILIWSLNSNITSDENGTLVYKTIDSDAQMYPIRIKAWVNYGEIDPFTTHFVEDFNRHSSIRIFGLNNDRFIGNVKLIEQANREKLNIGLYFMDGAEVFPEDFLISVKKLWNIKMLR